MFEARRRPGLADRRLAAQARGASSLITSDIAPVVQFGCFCSKSNKVFWRQVRPRRSRGGLLRTPQGRAMGCPHLSRLALVRAPHRATVRHPAARAQPPWGTAVGGRGCGPAVPAPRISSRWINSSLHGNRSGNRRISCGRRCCRRFRFPLPRRWPDERGHACERAGRIRPARIFRWPSSCLFSCSFGGGCGYWVR